jgi:methyl-accepting chemotaxis protein
MRRFNNLSTRTKLFVAFGTVWLLLAIVIAVAYMSINNVSRSEKHLHDIEFTKAIDLRELRSHSNYNRGQILDMMLTPNKSDQQAIEKTIADRANAIDVLINALIALDPDPQFQRDIQGLKSAIDKHRQLRQQEITLIYAGTVDEARQLGLGDGAVQFEQIRALSTAMGDKAESDAAQQVLKDQQDAQSSIRLFVIIGVVAFLVSLGMIVFLNQIVARPLAAITKVAQQIAAGDLSVTVPTEQRTDEIGALAQAFRQMVTTLRRFTADISEAVNLLGSTASEILASTTQVASGTAQAAAAINETTTTVEEVRQAAQLSSQKARYVSDSAQRVAHVSQTGQKAVEETVVGINLIRDQMESIAHTIVRLSEQSQSIGGIIASVTDIADQSNLLAVNAAIEAARAGEGGRGFAVVAQEIKSLAEQSKQATAQVRGILNDVQKATNAAVMATEQGSKAVEEGVKQSAQAGEAIQALAETTGEAVQAATQIVASSQQQVVGMDQIGTAMENINQAGAETAASMRQSEMAAQNLHGLGQKLKELVEQFKT